jgi:hypothetical protein
MLDEYKKRKGHWSAYEAQFFDLLKSRHIETVLSAADFDARTALLCSEATADQCHRRLVCEYLAQHWPSVRAIHL